MNNNLHYAFSYCKLWIIWMPWTGVPRLTWSQVFGLVVRFHTASSCQCVPWEAAVRALVPVWETWLKSSYLLHHYPPIGTMCILYIENIKSSSIIALSCNLASSIFCPSMFSNHISRVCISYFELTKTVLTLEPSHCILLSLECPSPRASQSERSWSLFTSCLSRLSEPIQAEMIKSHEQLTYRQQMFMKWWDFRF